MASLNSPENTPKGPLMHSPSGRADFVLQNAKNGTLYDMNCNFLSSVRYCKESPDTVHLIFPENPASTLPERIFLMPEGKEYDYRTFIFNLSADIQTCRLQDGAAEDEYYLVKGVTDDIQEVRKHFRVYISVRTSAYFDSNSKEANVTIKDIGCGGFLFISDRKYEPGETFSIILFNSSRDPLLVRSRIRKLRPVRPEGLYGYGCEYIDLAPQAESRIRNFVFHTEILQAKSKEV